MQSFIEWVLKLLAVLPRFISRWSGCGHVSLTTCMNPSSQRGCGRRSQVSSTYTGGRLCRRLDTCWTLWWKQPPQDCSAWGQCGQQDLAGGCVHVQSWVVAGFVELQASCTG